LPILAAAVDFDEPADAGAPRNGAAAFGERELAPILVVG